MKSRLLELLVCPSCQSELAMNASSETNREIEEGVLACQRCATQYPIVGGIPRFVKGEAYAASFGHQWKKHAQLQLDSQNGTTVSRQRFYAITEWALNDLKGKLALDAGCGAGRFSEIVLEAGAEVVAVDVSMAVDPCRDNLRRFPNLHCVQASIYQMPFRTGTFDYVFSIGVIQHCPDPREAVMGIVDKAAPGGKIGLWIYELSWKSFVGTSGYKYLFRPITRKLSIRKLEKFSAALESLSWPVNRIARKRGRIGRFIMRLLPVSCADLNGVLLSEEDFREWVRLDTFDMYSPSYDKPSRFSKVRDWLESAGCSVDRRHPLGSISITATRGNRSKPDHPRRSSERDKN
jgi:uncharacterized protein YbaR (Trm112 family)/ubiquinone/menaquinone biosynthesis C-methylase UbiE